MTRETVQILEPTHGAIQSPNGELQYYTINAIKNKNNPYLHQSALDEEMGTEYSEVECNGERIFISNTTLQQATNLEWNASIVRFLCLFDFMMNMFITLDTPYSVLYNCITSFVSISGYFSTITYSRSGLICYLLYQYTQSLSKLSLISLYIIATNSPQFYNELIKNEVHLIMPKFTTSNLIILIFAALSQIYITSFVQKFYNMLPTRRIIETSSTVLDRA